MQELEELKTVKAVGLTGPPPPLNAAAGLGLDTRLDAQLAPRKTSQRLIGATHAI